MKHHKKKLPVVFFFHAKIKERYQGWKVITTKTKKKYIAAKHLTLIRYLHLVGILTYTTGTDLKTENLLLW